MQLPATHGSLLLNVGFSYILAFEIEKVWGFCVLKWEASLLCFLNIFFKNEQMFLNLFLLMSPSHGFLYNSYTVS